MLTMVACIAIQNGRNGADNAWTIRVVLPVACYPRSSTDDVLFTLHNDVRADTQPVMLVLT
jgi:hypothetical protein